MTMDTVEGTLQRVDDLINLDVDLFHPTTKHEKAPVKQVKEFARFVYAQEKKTSF